MDYRIAWMFPDILFMHGERGNVLALKKYAELYGYNVAVDRIDFETRYFDPSAYDAIVFGVGEISSFSEVISWLKQYDSKLQEYIVSGRPMLVTGTSQAIFANRINRQDGSVINGLGYFPAVVNENRKVEGADLIYDCKYNDKELQIVASQIMMMDMLPDPDDHRGYSNFGKVIYGYGNDNETNVDGYILYNSIFTNALGPLLVCNPWLTVEMIKASAKVNGDELRSIDESFELERKSAKAKFDFNMDESNIK